MVGPFPMTLDAAPEIRPGAVAVGFYDEQTARHVRQLLWGNPDSHAIAFVYRKALRLLSV